MRVRSSTAALFLILSAGSTIGFAQPGQDPARPPQPQQKAGPNLRDSVDARAPEDRNASALLRRTRRNIADNEWAAAIQQLQSILNEPGDALVRLGPGRFVSMRAEANRLLVGMPRVWRQRYASQFGAAAEKRLNEALTAGDYSAVGDVATRYLHTDAGARAARAIALRHIDRGEFGMALRWFEVLRRAGYKPGSAIEALQLAATRKLSGLNPGELPESIKLGGRTIDPAALLSDLRPADTAVVGLTDWPMFLGNASRTAHSVDRLPLMVANWRHSLVTGGRVSQFAANIIRRVLDAQPGLVHAGVPIVAGNRVACRTAEGVSVFDLKSGELLWRTRREESSSDRFRAAQLSTQTRAYGMSSSTSREEIIESFLFRDAVHGLLASDGQRLIVVEEQGLPTQSLATSRFQNARSLELIRRNSINKLVAYNLQSGAQEWSVGGRDTPEVFKPVLAGEYFHGVPVAVDDELFVISERDNTIRLHALAASTGEVKWSQLLAYSDTRIERDLARRYWTSQVTVADGMLICPTTADWLVAVDPLTRSILWAHRYKAPETVGRSVVQQSVRGLSPLTGQWPAAAPVVIGDRVIYTPAEADIIEGLNLITGRPVWSQPKSDMRYIAGVRRGNAVVVSLHRVTALRASDGKGVWTTNLESDSPAGRGAITDRHLHLPTTAGQILSLDLDDGTITHRTGPQGSDRLLANIVMHAGGTILQTPLSIESLDHRPDTSVPPRSPGERLRAAEIAFADGRFDRAIELIDEIPADQLEAAAESRRRTTLIRSLRNRVERGAATAAEDVTRLAQLIDDTRQLARLRIVLETSAGNHAAAFGQLLDVYRANVQDPLEVGDRSIVAADRWLHGQLADTWRLMDEQARTRLDAVVAEIANESGDRRFVNVFAFHPAALESLGTRLTDNLEAGRFVEAEQILRTLRRHAPVETVAAAALKCADALCRSGQRVDAVSLLGEYGLSDRLKELPPAAEPTQSKWDNAVWSVQQFAGGGAILRRPEVPAWRSDVQMHRELICFSSSSEHQRLHFFSKPDDRITWSLPLRQASAVRSITPNGRSVLVAQRDLLSCLSPLEKRVLWQHPVTVSPTRGPRVFSTLSRPLTLQQPPAATGRVTPLAIINEEYVCLRGQRTMELRDAVTGEFLWSRDDLNPNDSIIGTTEAVLVRAGNNRTRVFRAADGQPLPETTFTLNRRVFSAIGRGFVILEESGFLFKKTIARLHDPMTGTDIWRLAFPAEADFALTDSRELVVRTGKSEFKVVNLVTGDQTALKTDKEFADQTLTVATTPSHVILAAIKSGSVYYRTTSQNIHGTLHAFDRQSGEELWDREVNEGSILLAHFRSLPVLLMTENEEQLDKNAGKIWDFRVVSTKTGKTLASHRIGSRYDQGQPTRFQPGHGFVEVMLSNRRFRFVARPPQPENGKATDQP